MKTVAVTGGIGSGKSTVCRLLSSRGIPVYDCDSSAKGLYDREPSLAVSLEKLFGCSLRNADGSLDRGLLASLIFTSPERLAALESIVHPAVLKAKREVALAESEHRLSKVLNRPTFSVGFAGEYTREVRYSGVSLGVTIPLWGRGRAESRSRRLAAEAVRTDMEATEIRLRRDVTRSWEEARSLWETAEELTAEQFRSEGVAKVRRAYEEGQA